MKISEIKTWLKSAATITFQLPDGKALPTHFHITEVGIITKNFIDCGGTLRSEKTAGFQLWHANDLDHRLKPEKLLNIITLAENTLNMEDLEIEVEYQGSTIGKYGLTWGQEVLILTSKHTDCLAKDNCGVVQQKKKVSLAELSNKNESCCAPGSKCC